MTKQILLVLGATLLCAGESAAQVVIDTTPTVRLDATAESANRRPVSARERAAGRLTIVARDGHYYWETRGNVEMVRTVSGAYTYFIAEGGAGYVKVLDAQLVPESMRQPGPRFSYMEHVSVMLATITYWGTANTFDERNK